MAVARRSASFWVVEAVAVLGGWLAAVLSGGLSARARAVALAAGAVCVVVPVWLQGRRERAAVRAGQAAEALAVHYQQRLATTLGDVVVPLASLLATIGASRGEERDLAVGQLTQAVVEAAARLCGGDRTRAIFFQREGTLLVPGAWTGRADAPTRTFSADDPRGATAFRLLAERDFLFVPDVTQPPDAGLELDADAAYRTFFSLPVFAAQERFGLLNVDDVEPGALDETDLEVGRALAHLLAAGLAAAAH